MPTYLRELSLAKTEAGSEDSSLIPSLSSLWKGGRKQSGLHSFVIAAPSRVSQCVCSRVSVRVCLPQES
jgi:hypothetical protein